MAVEGPARAGDVFLDLGLAYVVQKSRPAQPELGFRPVGGGNVVQYRKRVREIVFMTAAVHGFHALEGRQLRQNLRQQFSLVKQAESQRRPGRNEHFVQLFRDSFLGEYAQTVGHAAHAFDALGNDSESQLRSGELCRETDGAKHTQRIVGIGGVRIQGSADNACCKVFDAAERIHQLAERILIQREGHGVDGEVAAELVVAQGAVFHYGLAGLAAVGLLAGAYEFHFVAAVAQHRSAEITEIRNLAAGGFSYCGCEVDAAAFDHYVDVTAGPTKEAVAHITAYGESFYATFSSHLRNYLEDGPVDILCGYGAHNISS